MEKINLTDISEQETVAKFMALVSLLTQNEKALLALPGIVGVRAGFSSSEPPVLVAVLLYEELIDENYPKEIEGYAIEYRRVEPIVLLEGIPSIGELGKPLAEAAPLIHYTPPPKSEVALETVEVDAITCHIGPDSGWSTLKPFLQSTESTLTVAMYEYYADHIIKIMADMGTNENISLRMVLQVDKKEKEMEEKLKTTWGDRFKLVPAAVKGPNRIFNNSYHTKVAVKDSKSFWLSSGNWSPNSQPFFEVGSTSNPYRLGNREWHVIIDSPKLAGIFEKFILYDMRVAAAVQGIYAADKPDLLIPIAALEAEAAVIQPHIFELKTFTASVRVQPLMSPDNYAVEILKMIENAQESIYLQFSYIKSPFKDTYDRIISALAQKMSAGLDVKILVGSSQVKEDSELLIGARGWKAACVRKQSSKLHNKGVLIDGKIAVVGSNNWSNDGTQHNRDASLVFFSEKIYAYYHEVFMFDWNNLSNPVLQAPEVSPIIAHEGLATPEGMVRISWDEWYD